MLFCLDLAVIGPHDSLWPILISAVLIVGGIIGMVAPFIPGLAMIYLGAALHFFSFYTDHPISWVAFALMTLIFVVAQGLEMGAGFLGAQSQGMSRAGFIGGLVGLFLGLFLSVLGVIVGPPIGMFVGQRFVTRQPTSQALRTVVAFLVGSFVGMVFKVIGAVLILIVFGCALAGWI